MPARVNQHCAEDGTFMSVAKCWNSSLSDGAVIYLFRIADTGQIERDGFQALGITHATDCIRVPLSLIWGVGNWGESNWK